MKLFSKYSRISVFSNIIIFLIASTAFYFSLHHVLVNEIDEDLEIEESEILAYVKSHNELPESLEVPDLLITYEKSESPVKRAFGNTVLQTNDSKDQDFRTLTFSFQAKGVTYKTTVAESLESSDHLQNSILLITVITILMILLVSGIINRVVLKKLWKPFYQSLNAVKNFSITKHQPLKLTKSNVDEFTFMNDTLNSITQNSQLEYLALKTFSENASHEIQTPISIIRSKLDLVIQDEHLTEKQSAALQSAYDAIQKLSKLNQSLLLLAKIENNQFQETNDINLQKVLSEKIADFHDLWESLSIEIKSSVDFVNVRMNEQLADILINNLFSNGTRHNYIGGKINIRLNKEYLEISNTSKSKMLNPESMYTRFSHASSSMENTGLGLSIIRQICDASGFTIEYSLTGSMHVFKILFSSK